MAASIEWLGEGEMLQEGGGRGVVVNGYATIAYLPALVQRQTHPAGGGRPLPEVEAFLRRSKGKGAPGVEGLGVVGRLGLGGTEAAILPPLRPDAVSPLPGAIVDFVEPLSPLTAEPPPARGRRGRGAAARASSRPRSALPAAVRDAPRSSSPLPPTHQPPRRRASSSSGSSESAAPAPRTTVGSLAPPRAPPPIHPTFLHGASPMALHDRDSPSEEEEERGEGDTANVDGLGMGMTGGARQHVRPRQRRRRSLSSSSPASATTGTASAAGTMTTTTAALALDASTVPREFVAEAQRVLAEEGGVKKVLEQDQVREAMLRQGVLEGELEARAKRSFRRKGDSEDDSLLDMRWRAYEARRVELLALVLADVQNVGPSRRMSQTRELRRLQHVQEVVESKAQAQARRLDRAREVAEKRRRAVAMENRLVQSRRLALARKTERDAARLDALRTSMQRNLEREKMRRDEKLRVIRAIHRTAEEVQAEQLRVHLAEQDAQLALRLEEARESKERERVKRLYKLAGTALATSALPDRPNGDGNGDGDDGIGGGGGTVWSAAATPATAATATMADVVRARAERAWKMKMAQEQASEAQRMRLDDAIVRHEEGVRRLAEDKRRRAEQRKLDLERHALEAERRRRSEAYRAALLRQDLESRMGRTANLQELSSALRSDRKHSHMVTWRSETRVNERALHSESRSPPSPAAYSPQPVLPSPPSPSFHGAGRRVFDDIHERAPRDAPGPGRYVPPELEGHITGGSFPTGPRETEAAETMRRERDRIGVGAHSVSRPVSPPRGAQAPGVMASELDDRFFAALEVTAQAFPGPADADLTPPLPPPVQPVSPGDATHHLKHKLRTRAQAIARVTGLWMRHQTQER